MDWDAIWKRARSDLTVTIRQGDPDVFLWEHTSRVAHVAQRIAKLDVVVEQDPDEAAVLAAALYHDAAWAIRCRTGEVDRTEVLLTPLNDSAGEQSAALLEERLADLLPPGTLERAARAIRLMHEREPAIIEAQIIAEANNLEEFGLLSLWMQIRRGMLDGKGTQAVIETWRRKKEYHFWTARLRDSFRFEPTRRLAEQRLSKLERFMQELQEQFTGADISFGEGVTTAPKNSLS
jgi:hypothetical protein